MLRSLSNPSHHVQNFPLYKEADGPCDGWYVNYFLTFSLPQARGNGIQRLMSTLHSDNTFLLNLIFTYLSWFETLIVKRPLSQVTMRSFTPSRPAEVERSLSGGIEEKKLGICSEMNKSGALNSWDRVRT